MATITQRAVIEKILSHLGLELEVPEPSAARAPEWLPGVREVADYEDETSQWND